MIARGSSEYGACACLRAVQSAARLRRADC